MWAIPYAQCCCKNQKALYLLKIQDMIRLKSIVYLFSLLLSVTALHAQPLYVGEFNIRNDNAKDAAAGNGWSVRCPVVCDILKVESFDIFGT